MYKRLKVYLNILKCMFLRSKFKRGIVYRSIDKDMV